MFPSFKEHFIDEIQQFRLNGCIHPWLNLAFIKVMRILKAFSDDIFHKFKIERMCILQNMLPYSNIWHIGEIDCLSYSDNMV